MASARLCQPDGGGAAPRRSRTTRRSSLQYEHERGASAPSETLGGRCSVGAHFSRSPARLSQPDGGGAALRKNRTTQPPARRSYTSERGHPSKFTAFPSSFILSPELRRLSFPSRGSHGLVWVVSWVCQNSWVVWVGRWGWRWCS